MNPKAVLGMLAASVVMLLIAGIVNLADGITATGILMILCAVINTGLFFVINKQYKNKK